VTYCNQDSQSRPPPKQVQAGSPGGLPLAKRNPEAATRVTMSTSCRFKISAQVLPNRYPQRCVAECQAGAMLGKLLFYYALRQA